MPPPPQNLGKQASVLWEGGVGEERRTEEGRHHPNSRIPAPPKAQDHGHQPRAMSSSSWCGLVLF